MHPRDGRVRAFFFFLGLSFTSGSCPFHHPVSSYTKGVWGVGYFLHSVLLENCRLNAQKLCRVLRSYSTLPKYEVKCFDLAFLLPIIVRSRIGIEGLTIATQD